jgi:hypothetical protein
MNKRRRWKAKRRRARNRRELTVWDYGSDIWLLVRVTVEESV